MVDMIPVCAFRVKSEKLEAKNKSVSFFMVSVKNKI